MRCPHCDHEQAIKRGKTENGKQRYLCQQPNCPAKTFILDYAYRGYLPEVEKRIVDMALTVSGIRDTARVLKTGPTTVIQELKKECCIESVNQTALEQLSSSNIVVGIQEVEDTELGEMRSYVGNKENRR